jgi:hypothetical protein
MKHKHCRMERTNSNTYGVRKNEFIPSDAQIISETLHPHLQANQSFENPLFQYRDVFAFYNLTSIYNYFDPKINPGPFYTYLKEIFLYVNYFTREESLSSLNIAMQQVTDFLRKNNTKEDITNILHNVNLLNDSIGAESEVFKIALKLQQIHALYRGLMISDEKTSSLYKDEILLYDNVDSQISSQTALNRLHQITYLLDEKILNKDTVNNLTTDKLFDGIEVNVPDITPLSKNIKHEIKRLKRRGVSPEKIIEIINYVATRNIKKKKSKV